MRKDIIRSAINKVNGKVPYCIHFTKDGVEKHGADILKRYVNDKIMSLLNENKLSISEAMSIAIGNNVFGISIPWWSWDSSQTEFKTEYEIPHMNIKTFGYGSYRDLRDKIELVKEIHDAYITVLIWGSHIEKFQFLRGIENSLADMAAEPEKVQEILDLIIRKNMVMLENVVHIDDLDGILLGSDWGTQRDLLISPTMWRKMIKPGEQKEYDLLKSAGKDVWIHSCGNIIDILPDLVEMGVDVLNPIQPECMDIYKIKDNYGDSITFWGGISTQQTLPNGTPEEVRQETKQVIEYMSKNGGYITGPSQEIQSDVPFENICALIDTAKEYNG